MTKAEKVYEVMKRLRKIYPNPRTALSYNTPLELLVATILSAQATDKSVNSVTPALFQRFKNAKDYASADESEIDSYISKINFHKNKTKNIKALAKTLLEKHRGEVPDSLEELDALEGVARKTANVVLGNAFGKAEGIVVDTHVMRLSQKLGLTDKKDPEKIEAELMEIVPKKDWIDFSHLLILAGREYYPARGKELTSGPLEGLFV